MPSLMSHMNECIAQDEENCISFSQNVGKPCQSVRFPPVVIRRIIFCYVVIDRNERWV